MRAYNPSDNFLYVTASGCSDIISVTVSLSHGSSMGTALVTCRTTTKTLGDSVSINIGFTDDHAQIFTGYVKQIDKKVPDNLYTLTLMDKMTRAVDFFVVSSDPDNPFSRSNIQAEDLVEDIMALAGLTNYHGDTTNFTFAVSAPADVNLVSAYDYCKSIADLITYHLYADEVGKVWFINRKPYPIAAGDPELSQPGVSIDTPIGTIDYKNIIDYNFKVTEKDLRNKIVVYGSTGVYADASAAAAEGALPGGFYKTAALASQIINSNSMAQKSADYNLLLLNRVGRELAMTVIGDSAYLPRSTINVPSQIEGTVKQYYIYSAEHSLSSMGYITNLVLFR